MQLELQAFIIREARLKKESIVPIILDDSAISPWLEDRKLDYRNPSDRGTFEPIVTRVCGTTQVFVVMNMTNNDVKSAYEGVIQPELEHREYEVKNADGLYGGELITPQVLEAISKSGLILADLTGARPNCYLEVGYALALKRRVILTVYKNEEVHFDLAQYRILRWSTESELRNGLKKWLDSLETHGAPAKAARTAHR